jgi:hypothetical protein
MKRLTPAASTPALLLAALTLFALAAASAKARAQDEADVRSYWADGYELGVALRPTRPRFVLGESVQVELKVENRSEIDLELMLSGERGPGWPDDYEVTIAGPGGEALPRPPEEEVGRDTGYLNSFVRGPHNNQMSTPTMGFIERLDRWAKFERPGVYTVTLRRGLRAGPLGRRYRLFPGTTKPAVELRLTAEVVVVAGGEERVGRLVEELGAKMLGCDRLPPEQSDAVESAMRLSGIKDPRVVKYFAEALTKCKEGSIRSAALVVFAKFDTDEAFEGLRRAASDADEDFRTTAARELAGSRHPKARGLLLSLRKDPYYGVRLMVLNALERWDTAEARRLIWEMTNDEHPSVKEEALRFLQERAATPPRR